MLIKNRNHNKQGFTLIELSIVLIIIGLLVAGIVAGKSLIKSAHLTSAKSITKASPVIGMNGLAIWIETVSEDSFSDGAPVVNSKITKWKDINLTVTDKFHFEQATPANQPTYKLDESDGLPYLEFNGTNIYLASSFAVRGSRFSAADEITIFIVQKYISGDNVTLKWEGGAPQNAKINAHLLFSNGSVFWDFGPFVPAAPTSHRLEITSATVPSNFSNEWNLVTLIRKSDNDGEGLVRLNGSDLGSNLGMTSDNNISESALIRIGGDSGEIQNSHLREIIVFKKQLSDKNIAKVEKYLADKWDIGI
jgi:prepilin-type N-terminal cleavage/methylation domain-containing protein